jgi:hypothetical protein
MYEAAAALVPPAEASAGDSLRGWQPIATAPPGYENGKFHHVLFRGTSRGGSFAGYAYVSGWMSNDRKPMHSYSYKLDITDWMELPPDPPAPREGLSLPGESNPEPTGEAAPSAEQ